MKKLFISQPMIDKTNEEILKERKEAISLIKLIINEDVEIVDSFIQNAPHDANPLWFIGKSLEFLSTADVAYFCDGWSNYRGCCMEHNACLQYGIKIIKD